MVLNKTNLKGKVHRRTGHEGTEGQLSYSPTLSLTLVLDGVGDATSRPLYSRQAGPVLTVEGAGWALGTVWMGVKILAPPHHRDSSPGPSSP